MNGKMNYAEGRCRMQDITSDEVRQFAQFKDYTDQEVAQLIETIKAYTHFIYGLYSKQKKNGKVIAIINESENLEAA